MLEIFALCSCACLACLWCAVVLEMTKGRCCHKGLDEVFGLKCSKCSKDHRCIDRLKKFNRKVRQSNKTRDFEETRKKEEERSCCCCHRMLPATTSYNQPCSRSQSLPRLRPSHANITTCKRPCKICQRMKHGCACTEDNDPTYSTAESWLHYHHHHHRSSCPNLTSQDGRCSYCQSSPVRHFYHSLSHEPCKGSIDPNICKDRRNLPRQRRAARRKNRYFLKMKKEQQC